jgi:hypothetical protein
MAVSGHTNAFGTPGARKYVLSLDTLDDAARFNRRHRSGTGGRTAPDHPHLPEPLDVDRHMNNDSQ